MPSANLAYGSVRRIITVSIALMIIIASVATGLTAGVSTAQQEVTVASSEVTCYEEDGTLWEDYSYTLSEPHWIHQQFVVIDARTGEEIDTAQTMVGDVAGEEIDGVDGREDLGQYAQEYNDGEPVVLDIVVTDAESGEQIDRLEAPQECYDMAIDRFGEEPPADDGEQPPADDEEQPPADDDEQPPADDEEMSEEEFEADPGQCKVYLRGLLFQLGFALPLGPQIVHEELGEHGPEMPVIGGPITDSPHCNKLIGVLLEEGPDAFVNEEEDVFEEELPGGTEIPEENEPIIDPNEPRIIAPEEGSNEN